jgi:hypothetical protein
LVVVANITIEKERGAKCIVQMKDTQTVLIPPPGAEKTGKGGAKDHGPKVFNFDKSYWSFSKADPSYGASTLPALKRALAPRSLCSGAWWGELTSGWETQLDRIISTKTSVNRCLTMPSEVITTAFLPTGRLVRENRTPWSENFQCIAKRLGGTKKG